MLKEHIESEKEVRYLGTNTWKHGLQGYPDLHLLQEKVRIFRYW